MRLDDRWAAAPLFRAPRAKKPAEVAAPLAPFALGDGAMSSLAPLVSLGIGRQRDFDAGGGE